MSVTGVEIVGNKVQGMRVGECTQRNLNERKNLALDITYNRGHCNLSVKGLANGGCGL